MTSHIRVDSDGSLRLPAKTLERYGLVGGGDVVVEEASGGFIVRPVADIIKQAQEWSRALLEGKDSVTVDDFIAERHRSAATE